MCRVISTVQKGMQGNFNHTARKILRNLHGTAMPKGPKAHISSNALKGQKLLAQGNALGIMAISDAPCKGKSFKIHLIKIENPLRYVKLLPFTFPFGR